MGSVENATHVEVLIEESEEGLLLDSLKSANNSQLNVHRPVLLDLNFDKHDITKLTSAAIDLNSLISLSLSHCNLIYFPDAFAALKLKRLNLSHNRLKNVPDCIINGLRYLENLDLSYNELQLFEIEPKCVIKLRVLRINNNKFLNIPTWVLEVNCFNLEEFYYSYNDISSLKRSRFHRVGSYRLKRLELKNCFLRSEDLKCLGDIRTLTFLDLGNEGEMKMNCFVSGESFSRVLESSQWDDRLTILRLNGLQLSFLPEEIGKLTVLEELYCSKNGLLWLPDSLNSMKRLRVLDISENGIVSLLTTINNLKNLEILLASNNSISSTPDFSAMNLRVLDLYSNSLDIDCDLKINSIVEIDLERNFFDTRFLNEQGYEEKKSALRLGVVENRVNGPKEQHYDAQSDSYDTATTDSDWECNDQGAVEGDFKDRVDEEESWSPKREPCDNGCTASDNEWTGSERVYGGRKKIKPVLKVSQDWMFEDD